MIPVRRGQSPRTSASTEKVSVVGDSMAASAIKASSASIHPMRAFLDGRGRRRIGRASSGILHREQAEAGHDGSEDDPAPAQPGDEQQEEAEPYDHDPGGVGM